MNEKEMKEWKCHNKTLQKAYRDYLSVCNLPPSKRRQLLDDALKIIQKELEWPPFADFVSSNPLAFPFNTSRNGLDSETEKCISMIDKIAEGENKIE